MYSTPYSKRAPKYKVKLIITNDIDYFPLDYFESHNTQHLIPVSIGEISFTIMLNKFERIKEIKSDKSLISGNDMEFFKEKYASICNNKEIEFEVPEGWYSFDIEFKSNYNGKSETQFTTLPTTDLQRGANHEEWVNVLIGKVKIRVISYENLNTQPNYNPFGIVYPSEQQQQLEDYYEFLNKQQPQQNNNSVNNPYSDPLPQQQQQYQQNMYQQQQQYQQNMYQQQKQYQQNMNQQQKSYQDITQNLSKIKLPKINPPNIVQNQLPVVNPYPKVDILKPDNNQIDTEVTKFLKTNSLEMYIKNFQDEGYDDISDIINLDRDDLVSELKITKNGHIKKILRLLQSMSTDSQQPPPQLPPRDYSVTNDDSQQPPQLPPRNY